jgi:hypothetical protein
MPRFASHLRWNDGVSISRRAPFPPLILTLGVFAAAGIREIDFKNPDYPWDAPKPGAPETWKWLEVKPRSLACVVGGRCDFSSSDSPEGATGAAISQSYRSRMAI